MKVSAERPHAPAFLGGAGNGHQIVKELCDPRYTVTEVLRRAAPLQTPGRDVKD